MIVRMRPKAAPVALQFRKISLSNPVGVFNTSTGSGLAIGPDLKSLLVRL